MTSLKGSAYEASSRRGIQGVVVRLNGYSAITDASGGFAFNVPSGNYTISTFHSNFAPFSSPVSLSSDSTIGIPLTQTRVRAL